MARESLIVRQSISSPEALVFSLSQVAMAPFFFRIVGRYDGSVGFASHQLLVYWSGSRLADCLCAFARFQVLIFQIIFHINAINFLLTKQTSAVFRFRLARLVLRLNKHQSRFFLL
jgi:hypothetical protein